ncbi:MAG: dTDP-glucose 4,6-dehydratase [Chloroflexi bacterium]|nr:dTDP-glucose 4,6-dehydratase [Chloroflexota bacterium]
MRILVCGGAGFIGSRFVERRLGSTDDSMIVLDRLTYAGGRDNLEAVEADQSLAPRLRFVEGDICDAETVARLVADADAVVNVAAETHVDRSILDPAAALRTNVVGVHALLEAVRTAPALPDGRRRRYLQVSTDEVYGPCEGDPHRETDALAPRSPYAASKAAGDLFTLAAHETHDLDVVITRGANTYGRRQHPEKLVPLFITNAIDGQPLPLYGDGQQRRDWIFVDDHADAISTVLDGGEAGSIYNIPAGHERANVEVTRAILDHLGRPWSLVRRVEDRPGHDRRYAMAGERIASLGWSPATAFDDGIRSTVDWYREHEAWWRQRRDRAWDDYYEQQYGRRLATATTG